METNPNIILYLSYWEQIKILDEKQKGQLLSALFCFQLGDDIPELDPVTNMAFLFISADIKRNNDKYKTISEVRSEAGKKGGRPSKKDEKSDAEKSKKANESKKSNCDIEKEKEIEKEIDIENKTVCSNTQSRTREDDTDDTHTTHTETEPTRIPTHAAIREENANKGYGLSTESLDGFVEYNRDRGWKMNWRDALAKWAAREKERKKKHPAGSFANFPGRQGEEKEKNDDMAKKIIAMQTGGGG